MAGITMIETACAGHCACSMWADCGIQFRSNILLKRGDSIPLHKHSYDHIALIGSGEFEMKATSPEGEVTESRVVAGQRVRIPAWHQHTFTLISEGQGEVLCMWGAS